MSQADGDMVEGSSGQKGPPVTPVKSERRESDKRCSRRGYSISDDDDEDREEVVAAFKILLSGLRQSKCVLPDEEVDRRGR